MGNKVYYLITELMPNGDISHEFRTSRVFEGISDWLLKLRSPVTGQVNRSSWMTDIYIEINSQETKFKVDGFFDYEASVFDKESEDLILIVKIKTIIDKTDSVMKEKGTMLNHYQGNSHVKTRKMIEKRIKHWFGNDIGAATVLSVCAAKDPDHIFWMDQNIMTKLKILVM